MLYIKKNTTTSFTLPKTFRLDDRRLITNFDLLTNAQRIELAEVYPVTGEPSLEVWQSKSNPVFTFIDTEARVSYTITSLSLEDFKKQRIASVYSQAKVLLDEKTAGYSAVEVSTWPNLQAEVATYNADSSQVGPVMLSVISQGVYDAPGLSSLLTPRMEYQQQVIARRAVLTSEILAAQDHSAVKDIDIISGWPG